MKNNKPKVVYHFDDPNRSHAVVRILKQILIEKLLSLHKDRLTISR